MSWFVTGLTPSKLVLATDVLPPVEKSCITFLPGLDPLIETFELIAIYPVECVNLSVYRKHQRQTLKAHFCNDRVLFFELGGFDRRSMFWNLWCERVKFLSPEEPGSTRSETSVATSSSNSTLYLVNSRQVIHPNGLKQLWCQFGTGNTRSDIVQKWTDRYLYMGKNFDDRAEYYKPIVLFPAAGDFVRPTSRHVRKYSEASLISSQESLIHEVAHKSSVQISRFASGISEGCNTGLYLPAGDYYIGSRSRSRFKIAPFDNLVAESVSNQLINYCELAENAVRLWEIYKETDPNLYYTRHKRRYGFSPHPLFLHGLGPWNVSPGARYSIQIKRAVSMVSIRRQTNEIDLQLPIAKRQLIATISCETLGSCIGFKTPNLNNGPKKPVIFFWTPDYWYRPRSAKDAYLELQEHLNKIRDYRERMKDGKAKKLLFRKRYKKEKEIICDSESHESDDVRRKRRKKKSSLFNVFGSKADQMAEIGLRCCLLSTEPQRHAEETSLQYMRRVLKMDVVLTAWDFDSTTIAQQLTMIDKELFLKISGNELGILVWQQSSKNAPNMAASVAFSHRIGCLISTEILREDSEKVRARLIARFINVADKCHRMSNFQSCRSVLTGLQSPAIFRLKKTWAYVRKKHASKYQLFEHLSRIYRDPRLSLYQKSFFIASQSSPFMPYIGDVITKLLDRLPEYRISLHSKPALSRGSSRSLSIRSKSRSAETQVSPSLVSKWLRSFRLWKTNDKTSGTEINEIKQPSKSRKISEPKSLHNYYKPLNVYEDNREKCLAETIEFLEKCQLGAMTYSFGRNELCKDYLLKSRYREDKENFFNSLSTEPPLDYNWQMCNKI